MLYLGAGTKQPVVRGIVSGARFSRPTKTTHAVQDTQVLTLPVLQASV
jgi:hypothetical protein